MIVVIWGVSGVGKTTIGELLARELGWKFYDADDFHPAANIEKMHRGQPLNDEDRAPWLQSLRQRIEQSLTEQENAVLACSALKKKYRDELRINSDVKFVMLRGTRERVAGHLKKRRGHFFDPELLDSQFADLEEPAASEKSLVVDVDADPHALVARIKSSLRADGA